MKKKKKYTPQMRKAINDFFENDTEEVSYEDIDSETLRTVVETIISVVASAVVDGENEQGFVAEMMGVLTSDENLPLFLKLIQNKLTVEEMCLKYHCGRETVRRRCKEFFDCSITELRTVENSGQFIKVDINKEELYQDIIECKLNNQQIAAKYGVSDHTIVNRCKEFFNKTPNELRGNQGAKRAFIDNEELLNRLILEGRTLQEVASVFQMSKNTLVTRLKEKYQMNFKEYREYVKSKN